MANKRYTEQIDEFIYDKNQTSMPATLGTLIFVCFSVVLMIVITFTNINLFQLVPAFGETGDVHFTLQNYPYIAQIPFIVLISSLLGMRFSLMSVIMYILLGIFLWPVFAFGGGISYLKTSFFGYILGYIPCAILVSLFLGKYKNFKGVLFASLLGPVSVYILGILYGLLLLTFKQVSGSIVYFELLLAICAKLPYDILFSFFAVLIAKPLRSFLWLMCGNTKKSKKKA